MSENRKGVLYVFLAAVLYSLGGLGIKLIPTWNGLALNAGRSIIALFVYVVFFVITKHKPKLNKWVLLGACCVCATNVLFALANKITTAANTIVLEYTAPIFVILLSALLLHRRPDKLDLAACALVFLGVLCFFLESLGGGHLSGDLMALLSGLTYGGVFMLNDMPDGDPISCVFWAAVMSAFIGLPQLLQQPRLEGTALASLFVLGIFQMGLAFVFLTMGLKTTPPITASLVTGIEPVLNPILVAVFYHEYMGVLSVIGAVVVIAGVVGYNILKEKQQGRTAEV